MKVVFKLWLAVAVWGTLAAVASGRASAADFTVANQGMTAYLINNAANPQLTLTRGHTYTFSVNSPGHPFFIKTVAVTGTGSTFDTGVTNNGATGDGTTPATLTFVVPTSAPDTLFYACQFHTAMQGQMNIVSAPVPATGGAWLRLLAFGLLLAGTGLSWRWRRAGRSTAG